MAEPSDAPRVPSGPAPPARTRFRLTAIVAFLASLAWLLGFLLPWILVPEAARERVRVELRPKVDELARRAPQEAEGVRALLDHVVLHGHLAGLDLFHYVRRALALHRHYEGVEPFGEATATRWVVRRALRLAAVVLAGLPAVCVLLALLLLAGGLRRVGAPTLTALVVTGATGAAVSIAWLRVVESLTWDVYGAGMRLSLVASLAQMAAGLFGVSGRNWWRVYLASIAILGVLGALAWTYVERGVLP